MPVMVTVSHVPVTVRSPAVKLQVALAEDDAHAVTASFGGPWCPGPWRSGGGPLGRQASPSPLGALSHVPVTVRSPMVKLQLALAEDDAHAATASCAWATPPSSIVETAMLQILVFISRLVVGVNSNTETSEQREPLGRAARRGEDDR